MKTLCNLQEQSFGLYLLVLILNFSNLPVLLYSSGIASHILGPRYEILAGP